MSAHAAVIDDFAHIMGPRLVVSRPEPAGGMSDITRLAQDWQINWLPATRNGF
jgi:hypothetical protein